MLVPAVLVVGAAWALDPPKPSPAPQAAGPAAGQPARPEPAPATPAAKDTEATAADATAKDDEETLPPLPPGSKATGPTPQRFDPSEEVRADFPVSFPVDI
jgi:hypothetical protein